jgi:hypothetical protein
MKDMVYEGNKILLNAKYLRLVSNSMVKTLLIVETSTSYTLIPFFFQNILYIEDAPKHVSTIWIFNSTI